MPANIPFRIKQRRKELSLSQSALAQACGVGQSPVNNYLSRPIRHIPVFNWPRHAGDLNAATPQSYIALAAAQDNVFGLALEQDMESFKAGTILTFTRDYDKTDQGLFLDLSESESSLSETQGRNSKAKLVYSLTPH